MRGRLVALRVILVVVSVVLFLGTGELALRVVYRDAGKRTLGGPGGHGFEHLSLEGDQRGRFDAGPRTPGKPRIMIVGDSITWGQGVRNWQDAWPEQLALALERAGTPHEMAVVAFPGRDIVQHVDEVEHWAPQIQPDIFIYQWYVNDIEVEAHRPANRRAWRAWPMHDSLLRASYLYYFLDNRLASFLPPPDRSYVDYILEDYAPGTLEWSEFERLFHRLAAQVSGIASRRLLLLYPQVPFRDSYPLKPIHDRVAALAGPHRLAIPPAAWIRHAGAPVERRDAPFKQAVQIPARTKGPVVESREYYMPAGGLDVVLTIAFEGESSATLGALEAIDATSNQVIGSVPIKADAGRNGWQDLTLHPLRPAAATNVRLRVNSSGEAPFLLALIALPVDYGFTVVDPTDELNTFNTHASIFDAHPNERAHKVVAERVFEVLRPAR